AAYVGQGLPAFAVVGLPDTAPSEARDRSRAAVLNTDEPWPRHRITVNLSPAWLPKAGSGFDLALAAGVLAASGRVPPEAVAERVLLGELGLDGRVRAVRGVLPAVLAAVAAGFPHVVVPAANAAEAAIVPDARVSGVSRLRELLALLRGEEPGPTDQAEETRVPAADQAAGHPSPDLAD